MKEAERCKLKLDVYGMLISPIHIGVGSSGQPSSKQSRYTQEIRKKQTVRRLRENLPGPGKNYGSNGFYESIYKA